jgi:hypothetical protein
VRERKEASEDYDMRSKLQQQKKELRRKEQLEKAALQGERFINPGRSHLPQSLETYFRHGRG